MAGKTASASTQPPVPPSIVYVPLGPLVVYQITEQELDLLEKGTPESPYFGFAVFLLSTGISFLTILLTVKIPSQDLADTFKIFTWLGLIEGLLLLVVWHLTRRSTVSIVKTIRARKLTVATPP